MDRKRLALEAGAGVPIPVPRASCAVRRTVAVVQAPVGPLNCAKPLGATVLGEGPGEQMPAFILPTLALAHGPGTPVRERWLGWDWLLSSSVQGHGAETGA